MPNNPLPSPHKQTQTSPINKYQKGYQKDLLILPFDHRGSFQEKLFGILGTPTEQQTNYIASFKSLIYEGFKQTLSQGLPKESMGILVDEQFGTKVIEQAKSAKVLVAIPAEKSGQDEFDFEYGAAFKEHIEKINPDFVKVLVRYNPAGDKKTNERQLQKLATLNDYLEEITCKFMFELLVPPTDAQLLQCNHQKSIYDLELRPSLMIQAIKELQEAAVEPDIWKIEGLDRKEDCERVAEATKREGRDQVACIILGRGENEDKVKEWLEVAASVKGYVGFAVGRTVFWEPLKLLKENKITKDVAIDKIAKNYMRFCQVWFRAKNN